MNGKFKALTLAIVAMFCLTAAVCVIDDKDSSAADSVDHYLYFEVINEDGLVTSSDWIKFTSTTDVTNFVDEANKALKYFGYSKIVFSGSESYIGVSYDGSNWNSCFAGSEDGKSWVQIQKTTEEYPVAKYIALELNGYVTKETYEKFSDDVKKEWTADPYSYYYRSAIGANPTDADSHKFPEEYTSHVFVEVIGADGKSTSTKWVEFKTLKTIDSFVANANDAFANNGLSKLKFVISSYVSISYDGGGKNASFFAKDKEWVKVDVTEVDYLNDTIALAVGNGYITKSVYDALSDSEKESWKDTTWGDPYAYIRIIGESTTGYESSSSNNTGLIVGIVVVVIVAASFVFLKKK